MKKLIVLFLLISAISCRNPKQEPISPEGSADTTTLVEEEKDSLKISEEN